MLPLYPEQQDTLAYNTRGEKGRRVGVRLEITELKLAAGLPSPVGPLSDCDIANIPRDSTGL